MNKINNNIENPLTPLIAILRIKRKLETENPGNMLSATVCVNDFYGLNFLYWSDKSNSQWSLVGFSLLLYVRDSNAPVKTFFLKHLRKTFQNL